MSSFTGRPTLLCNVFSCGRLETFPGSHCPDSMYLFSRIYIRLIGSTSPALLSFAFPDGGKREGFVRQGLARSPPP